MLSVRGDGGGVAPAVGAWRDGCDARMKVILESILESSITDSSSDGTG